MASGEPVYQRRVLLIGFMASGKSTVGPLLAERLGWSFLDVDNVVEDEVGLPIPDIFEVHGETFFRAREHEATLRALERDACVVAAGGGWPTVAGRMESLDATTASVWLDVPASELLRRVESAPGARPLLAGPDPEERVGKLLQNRERFYRMASLRVDGRGLPERVAERIAQGLSSAQD